jgi:hypothetical protein
VKASEQLAVGGRVEETDRVSFSLVGLAAMAPGSRTVLEVWAHLPGQRDQIPGSRIISKAGTRIIRGTTINVHLVIAGLAVKDPDDVIIWDGEPANATFPIDVPAGMAKGQCPGTVLFLVGGIQVAKLHFVIEIGLHEALRGAISSSVHQPNSAFASYAHKDRNDVLARIQGMCKIDPSLDVFLDVASLRSGEQWSERLISEIERRDVFYLFWSDAARRSEWVTREWRTALEKRGVAYIDPVPLVSPDLVPPPDELRGHLHFDDWMLRYMSGRSQGGKKSGR